MVPVSAEERPGSSHAERAGDAEPRTCLSPRDDTLKMTPAPSAPGSVACLLLELEGLPHTEHESQFGILLLIPREVSVAQDSRYGEIQVGSREPVSGLPVAPGEVGTESAEGTVESCLLRRDPEEPVVLLFRLEIGILPNREFRTQRAGTGDEVRFPGRCRRILPYRNSLSRPRSGSIHPGRRQGCRTDRLQPRRRRLRTKSRPTPARRPDRDPRSPNEFFCGAPR